MSQKEKTIKTKEIKTDLNLASLNNIINAFWVNYKAGTSAKLQLIDTFLIFAFMTGVTLALYVVVAGSFPFNSFLSGFASCVGFFILTACLRLQINNPKDFHNVSEERAFADYVFCNFLLFFVVFTFMG